MAQARKTEEEVKREVAHLKDEIEALKEQARERGQGFSSLNEEQLTKKVRSETSKSPFIYAQSWTSGTVAKFAAIVALAVLSLVCPTGAGAQVLWSGWARCEIEIKGSTYTNTETHDWVAINATQGGGSVTGTWIVTGSGELSNSAQLSRWSISSGVQSTTNFQAQVSGGQVSIKRMSSPAVPGGIAGYTVSLPGGHLSKITAQQEQWAFPSVMGSTASTELKSPPLGSPTVDNPGHGYLRDNANLSPHPISRCMWWFKRGSMPPPPPPPQSAPIASGVTITGGPVLRNALTGNYVYYDAASDPQGTSTFRWLRDGVAIPAATGPSYTLVNADVGKIVIFEVTPVAQSGPSPGVSVMSSPVGPVTCPELPMRPTSWVWTSWFQKLVDFLLSRFRPSGTATLADPCP